jgi:trans-AT polyketide synthase/acyltransferase/oxidoreductase domain-containing protein
VSSVLASWSPSPQSVIAFDHATIAAAIATPRHPLHVVRRRADGAHGVATQGQLGPADVAAEFDLIGHLPALYPEWLGDRGFCEAHGTRFAYVSGAMANGIATPQLVIAMGRAQMLGFFGAAGLSFEKVERGLQVIRAELEGSGAAWGVNLIHSPNEPTLEERVADLYIRHRVPRVSAAAYMKLSPSIVRYAYSGLSVGPDQRIVRPHNVFAKISRIETAQHFMNPAPEAMLRELVASGLLTEQEARIGATLPVAEDITAESDSGGHTDNRPLSALLPNILAGRDAAMRAHDYARPIRVGAAGGMGTPSAVAAAYAMGAAYVLTGSVNQAAVESGLSEAGRQMLANASMTDVIMAPAADMFELGVEVQVLKRGTMFGTRAKKLHDVYKRYSSLEEIPADERAALEKRVLGAKIDDIWQETHAFWSKRDPEEAARATDDPKHRMALVFRWYLGKASKWAIDGESSRAFDYQIWCGPAMGAFNTWVKDSFLEPPESRHAVQIALNLLEGAAHISRAQQLRTMGVGVPASSFDFRPRKLSL